MLSNWLAGGGSKYFNTVWNAVTNAEAFSKFRRHPDYNAILEHVRFDEGERYLEALTDGVIRRICLGSIEADTVGGPVTYQYDGAQISPTTLRYGKVAQDIVSYFPNFLKFKRVAEIGGGYGGQLRMLSEYCKAKKSKLETFTLVDMLPVILLAQSYLDNFDIYPAVEYVTKSQIPRDRQWDFVYSNYAFSEFDRSLQDEYVRLIIGKSSNGMLTMNTGVPGKTEWNPGALTIHDLLKMLPNAVIVRDEPETIKTNYVVVFGQHSLGSGVPVEAFLASAF